MKTREEIFNIYLTQFSNDVKVLKISNPFYVPDEQSIIESMKRTQERYGSVLPEIELTDSETIKVLNRIKSVHSVHQDEGDALLGDYEHDFEWYKKFLNDEPEEYYWNRYKNYLAVQKHFAPEIIDRLENNTLYNIMKYIGNPKDEAGFSIRGLVVGDVQSGKTSNYIGLVTKAADAGYKVIFILTGTIESLRKQTQERVEEGFIGYDVTTAEDVGVGRGEKTPKSFTSRLKDFVADDDQNTNIRISNYPSEPMVFVLKKNASVLHKLYTSLKNINTTKQYQKINAPMLLIDDEADNASINTRKAEDDPTKINKYIRNILKLFVKSSYVGFTATPFANVFISYDSEDEMLKDDLFPRDFIYSLKAPSNYCGSRRYFFDDNNNVRYIDDGDEVLFPMKHKKEWNGDRLFASVYKAVNCFLIANTIRDIRDADVNTKTNRSMLINMTRYMKVQLVIKDIIEEYYTKVKNAVKQCHKLDLEYALTNPLIASLKTSFEEEYNNIIVNGDTIKWCDILQNIWQSIKDISIIVVNSSKQSAKLNYDDHKDMGLRVIAIGGLALSRGLTLEGLCVSYFYRNTATFDVLMQMGRWFGYRDVYDDLCKIFITRDSAQYYRDICLSIEDLRKDIEIMGSQNKKPEDYGIRVRNDSLDLGITAANKSRNTKKIVYHRSFYGSIFETPHLHRDLDIMEHNIDATLEFLKKINISQKVQSVKHPYFINVPKQDVIQLLSSVSIHKAESYFDAKQILSFLRRTDFELNFFDVLIIGGQQNSNKRFVFQSLDVDNALVRRAYDIPDEDKTAIRINRQHLRLGGKEDTKNGLTEEQIKGIEGTRASAFMIKGRNPLLIIYFVYPDNSGLSEEEVHSGASSKAENEKIITELEKRKYKYLVGYGIGFPQKDNAITESILYTVNKTVNYFEKEHSDEGDDGNE